MTLGFCSSVWMQVPELSVVLSADQLEVPPPLGYDNNARFSFSPAVLLRLVLCSFHQDGPQGSAFGPCLHHTLSELTTCVPAPVNVTSQMRSHIFSDGH